jgi:hypothetical protein
MTLRDSFLPRWILANTLGWIVGLYLGFWNPVCFLGTGVIAGLTLGFAQWWVLFRPSPPRLSPGFEDGRPEGGPCRDTLLRVRYPWIWMTLISAAVGMLPALLIGFLLSLWSLAAGLLVSGAILGGAVGLGQWSILRHSLERPERWVMANTLGGAVCGLLTAIPIIRGLPLGLLLGSALFGYITGWTLEQMTNHDEDR